MLVVDENVKVFLATKSLSSVTSLILPTSVYVTEHGELDLPETVVIERGYYLELCGALKSTTRYLTVRENGEFRSASPAHTSLGTANALSFHSIAVQYNGKIEKSDICSGSTTSFTIKLHISYFNSSDDFVLDSNYVLESGYQPVLLTPEGNKTCSGPDLYVANNKECTLTPGDHVFDTVVVEWGGLLTLVGDATGANKTTITANTLEIKRGGKVIGDGKGYKTNGPGQATSSGSGATHGGAGEGNSANPYGDIMTPMSYGSNGHSASTSQGLGGGQIKITAYEKFLLDGELSMNGLNSSTSGGSGGSVWIFATNLEGRGSVSVDGGTLAGGGRIAISVNETYDFHGILSAKGAANSDASSGTNIDIDIYKFVRHIKKILGP